MLQRLGPEFEILRKIPLEEIQAVSGHRMAEGIARLREGKAERIPGFDGEYGTIRLSVRKRSVKQKDNWISLLFLERPETGNQDGLQCKNQEELLKKKRFRVKKRTGSRREKKS